MSLVPELYVSAFARTLAFYTDVIGFRVRYDRPEERFAYLELDSAELIYPYGRGFNLSIEVPDVDAVHGRV